MATGPAKQILANAKQTHDLLSACVNPNWDRLLEVKPSEGSFCTWVASKVDLPPGALFAHLTGISQESLQSYNSVQAGHDLHIDFNTNARFINHSCDPTLDTFGIHVRRDRALKKGETLSFLYPSTEWMMAQPFNYWSGAGKGKCCGRIDGAGKMDEAVLKRYWLNGYIEELLMERNESQGQTKGE